jgi:hypothetical protein
VSRKTQRERLCKKLKALNVRLADLRTMGGNAMLEYVVRHLQGHIQYYGVSGNFRSAAVPSLRSPSPVQMAQPAQSAAQRDLASIPPGRRSSLATRANRP